MKISVKYTNEITNDIIHSTQYYTKYINKAILANLQGRPLKLDRLIVLQETQIFSHGNSNVSSPHQLNVKMLVISVWKMLNMATDKS